MIKAMLNFKCGMGRLCVCVCVEEGMGAGKEKEGGKERGGGREEEERGPRPRMDWVRTSVHILVLTRCRSL